MAYVVDVAWLYGKLHDPAENVVVVDCRFSLQDSTYGRNAYLEGHIPGAVYADLDKDLSSPKQIHGGRHPLPPEEQLATLFGRWGIDSTKTVVAYDAQGGAMASRFWWLLHYLGHPEVYVLDGGYQAWVEEDFETTTQVTTPEKRTFTPQPRTDELVSMIEVKNRLTEERTLLVDSRESNRYLGIEEPIDPVAGHIPGAINLFWKDVLNDGTEQWKSADDLITHFANLPAHEEIIVYCGSGVSACPNILALKEAGFDNVKLYAGSWSDWISYSENPVATGEK
ncbi:sulfurtransferase [Aureibacillus halotolerans]|uniref:Thiosulfate/3-mercaptopyruvate sulfurtransferase n=1 Tax=Aureibacillus halotolerans TaxID=1508390 RepID=A0A4R6UI74_9BACI|nr:sulfurtransferase [Aureibacillus halotolerans]TDQ42864.1 thiosulfate/3-mercaptopyruvate sulfurtransferase [Aureibacillus halotolerans]